MIHFMSNKCLKVIDWTSEVALSIETDIHETAEPTQGIRKLCSCSGPPEPTGGSKELYNCCTSQVLDHFFVVFFSCTSDTSAVYCAK